MVSVLGLHCFQAKYLMLFFFLKYSLFLSFSGVIHTTQESLYHSSNQPCSDALCKKTTGILRIKIECYQQ